MKLISYLTLVSGLSISAVAIFYSITGLISIFPGEVTSIIVMGAVLEISKLIATVWLKQFWNIAPKTIKSYLTGAIIVLMLITSLGIFGFLSKAHLEHTSDTGDLNDQISIIDERIQIQQDTIDNARKALSQLNGAVDETLNRSTTEKSALRSMNIRKSQKEERDFHNNSISEAQKVITKLKDERAPLRSKSRKAEVEFGPVKYVASLLYNDSQTNLENAVKIVIIFIVIVFDPLAVILLLCSQYSFNYIKSMEVDEKIDIIDEPKEHPVPDKENPVKDVPEEPIQLEETIQEDLTELFDINNTDTSSDSEYNEKLARSQWKDNNKNDTIKHHEKLLSLGLIDKLPWDNSDG